MSNSGIKVFVIDDDGSVRASLSRLLRCSGFACQAFASGEEFLAELKPDEPGCAIVDIHMAGMDGIELMLLLRRTRPLVSAILMTAFDNPDECEAAATAGVTILRKPFDDSTLLSALSREM